MERKIRILVLTNYYLPGKKAGGPVRSMENFVEHLGDDFEIKIITSDRDLGDNTSYTTVDIDKWNSIGKASVFYASPEQQKFKFLVKLMKSISYDVLYLNSFFQPTFTIKPLVAYRLGFLKRKKIVIAPRGDLMEASLEIKKIKKYIYLTFAKTIGLYTNCVWQASNNIEEKSVRENLRKQAKNIIIAPNLTPRIDTPNKQAHKPKEDNKLKICYIARVSKEKNLLYALEIISKVSSNIVFDIYGPIEDQIYWSKCKVAIKSMGSNTQVNHKGTIEHKTVPYTFSLYDLFFLPTTGENFGHSIIESMLAATPVLIADTTPWKKLEEKGVGWDFPLDTPSLFVDKMDELCGKAEGEYAKLRDCTQKYAVEYCNDGESLMLNKKIFSIT